MKELKAHDVVTEAMHNRLVPLTLAQGARDEAETMHDLLRKIERWTSDEVMASRGTGIERNILTEIRQTLKGIRA